MASLNRRDFARAVLGAVYAPGVPACAQPRHFNIIDYGAVPGGGMLCTEAIQRAINACAAAGGGRVVVPPG